MLPAGLPIAATLPGSACSPPPPSLPDDGAKLRVPVFASQRQSQRLATARKRTLPTAGNRLVDPPTRHTRSVVVGKKARMARPCKPLTRCDAAAVPARLERSGENERRLFSGGEGDAIGEGRPDNFDGSLSVSTTDEKSEKEEVGPSLDSMAVTYSDPDPHPGSSTVRTQRAEDVLDLTAPDADGEVSVVVSEVSEVMEQILERGVSELVCMGFESNVARRALRLTKSDVNSAVDLLFSKRFHCSQ